MIRSTLTALCLAGLAACGDPYDGPIGRDPVVVSRFGAVGAVPTANGTFPGIAAADTTVVSDGAGNGYAFAYAGADAGDFGGTAGPANLAVAGLLPGTAVGATPTTGTARMTGTYRMVVIDNASATTAPETWTVSRPTGAVTADIDFATGALTGASADGALTLTASGDAGFSQGFAGDVTYRGTAGRFAGVIGPDDAVAALTGSGGGTFYAGGVTLGR